MKFGIGIPNSREGLTYPSGFCTPDDFIKLAQLAERLGFDSVWADDHMTPTSALLSKYTDIPNFHDPMLTLTYVASATKKVSLGIAVMIVIWRDPVLIAKQAATLDRFSNGRFILGVGLGSREEFEMLTYSQRKYHRGRMLDEELDIIATLFTQDKVSHKGEYYEFHNLNLRPRPVQDPVPVYFAGAADALPRIVKHGHGWFITPKVEEVRASAEALKKEAAAQRKEVAKFDLITSTTISIAKSRQAAEARWDKSRVAGRAKDKILGTPAEIVEEIHKLGKEGLTHFTLQRFAANEIKEMTEQIQLFGEEVIPHCK